MKLSNKIILYLKVELMGSTLNVMEKHKNILTKYFLPQKTQRFLFKNALENTELAKLNQYKALRALPFIKAKSKKT